MQNAPEDWSGETPDHKTSHNNDFQMICVPRQLGNPAKDMAAGHARCC